MAERESFVFYKSFYDAIQNIPQENQLEIYNAITVYGLTGKEIKLEGVSRAIFILIKPQLVANYVKYTNGLKGGKPKHHLNATKLEPKPNQHATKPEPNVNDNDNVNVNVNDNVKCKYIYTENFEKFWSIYPRRTSDSKMVAFKSYKKALKITTHETIIEAVEQYKITKEVKSGHNKMSSTWLNQRMWENVENQQQALLSELETVKEL